jgi:hypothetical protein
MRRTIFGWWVMVTVLALSAPAMAHAPIGLPLEPPLAPPSLETLVAGAPSLDGLGALLAATAVALIVIARRRRAVAVACMVLLLVVAFESGVHSVHHLTDQPDAQCVVASASIHVGGVAVATVAFDRPAETITAVTVTPTGSPANRPAAPDLGRAPPLA